MMSIMENKIKRGRGRGKGEGEGEGVRSEGIPGEMVAATFSTRHLSSPLLSFIFLKNNISLVMFNETLLTKIYKKEDKG